MRLFGSDTTWAKCSTERYVIRMQKNMDQNNSKYGQFLRNGYVWQWRMMQSWRGFDLSIQNGHHNLTNVEPSLQMSQKILLTKVYNIWPKKVQKSYDWWHWRLMLNLKENWSVLSKNDMRNLENFHRLKNNGFILASKRA